MDKGTSPQQEKLTCSVIKTKIVVYVHVQQHVAVGSCAREDSTVPGIQFAHVHTCTCTCMPVIVSIHVHTQCRRQMEHFITTGNGTCSYRRRPLLVLTPATGTNEPTLAGDAATTYIYTYMYVSLHMYRGTSVLYAQNLVRCLVTSGIQYIEACSLWPAV